MTELLFLIDEAPEGGYCAQAVGESIFTEANTLDELHAKVREAISCHFEGESQSLPYLLQSREAV